jgi:hypothetical protein
MATTELPAAPRWVHALLYRVLAGADELLRTAGVPYSAIGPTLVSAVRDQGLGPFDDGATLAFRIEDTDRLLAAADAYLPPRGFALTRLPDGTIRLSPLEGQRTAGVHRYPFVDLVPMDSEPGTIDLVRRCRFGRIRIDVAADPSAETYLAERYRPGPDAREGPAKPDPHPDSEPGLGDDRPRGPALGRPSVVILLAGFGASVRVTDTSDLGIADRLAALMPPDLVAPADGPATTEYIVEDERDGVTVRRRGRVEIDGYDAWTALSWLRATIDHTLATEATEAMFVHAGVVGRRGHAVVVPGRPGTGKSSLIEALSRRGAEYYSDEYAVIDDAGLVHSYARLPSIGDGLPTRRRIEPRSATPDRPPLPVAVVLSTAFEAGADWNPRVLTGASRLLPLLDNVITAREQPQRALSLAARVAPGLVTLVGPRPEAETVADAILERVDAVLAARP